MEPIRLKAGDAELECFSHGAGTAIILVPGGSLAAGYLSALAAAGLRAIRVNPRGAAGKVEPRPEAQHALQSLFKPTSSDTEILDAMQWMARRRTRPASGSVSRAAARPQPRRRRWPPHGPRPWRTGGHPPGDVPYLVIQGLKDEAAPAENGHLLKKELGDRVTLVDIPGTGHLQPLEAPGPVAEAVIAFVR